MLPHQQLEHDAQTNTVTSDEDFPFCTRCNTFTYLDYTDRCMRCNGRNIIWKRIPDFAPKSRNVPRGTLLVLGLLFIAVAVLGVWLLR